MKIGHERNTEGLFRFLRLDEEMKIRLISKGQRAKTKLLLTLSRRAPYALMDEPLSGIDILTRAGDYRHFNQRLSGRGADHNYLHP